MCDGEGFVITKPGGAGKPMLVGEARCKQCNGTGRIPCALCAGYELVLPPADPFREAQRRSADDEDDEW